MSKGHGHLVIIGGHEAKKKGERTILEEVVQLIDKGTGRLVIVTAATNHPEEVTAEYRRVFHELGVRKLEVLDIRSREQAQQEASAKKLEGAQGIFFTGGDQLRITSQLGNSPLCKMMRSIYEQGGVIIGTSAGAAAMPDTMLVAGEGEESPGSCNLSMAAGLGLISGVTIDSHFAQRGRIGRLLAAVTQNPINLGLGIDEDTAILVQKGKSFRVIGSGAVYVIDGSEITYSSLSEEHREGILSMHDVKLHVLGSKHHFDLVTKRPLTP